MSCVARPRLTRRGLRREWELQPQGHDAHGELRLAGYEKTDLARARHDIVRREKVASAVRSAQAKLVAQSAKHERGSARVQRALRCKSAKCEAELDAEIKTRMRALRNLEKQCARQEDLQQTVARLRKRLEAHMSDELAKKVTEAMQQRDQLLRRKRGLDEQVGKLKEKTQVVENLRNEIEQQTGHIESLAAREEALHGRISDAKASLRRSMPSATSSRRKVALPATAATVFVDEPAPPGFAGSPPDWKEAGVPRQASSELAPGEGIDAPWRKDLAKPILNLRVALEKVMASYFWIKEATRCEACTLPCETMFVSKKTGRTSCRNCVRGHGRAAVLSTNFEDPNFDSIMARLEMNGAFEAAMEAVLKMLREDLSCVMQDPIERVRTRFSVYTKLLGMQTTQNNLINPAKEAALRVGTVWRERARRGTIERLQQQQQQEEDEENEKQEQT